MLDENTARRHCVAFFREGRHRDLVRIAREGDPRLFEALADKAACKRISHLRGETLRLAYDMILAELRRRAGLEID